MLSAFALSVAQVGGDFGDLNESGLQVFDDFRGQDRPGAGIASD